MKFSAQSQAKLESCHEDLQLIFNTAIKLSQVDFGIAEGHRSVEKQQEYYKAGKSEIDGVHTKGKHNYYPSLAVDFFPVVKGKADYSDTVVAYVAGIIHGVGEYLYYTGKVTHKLRWGGNFDGDGEIITDQKLKDLVHFEI